ARTAYLKGVFGVSDFPGAGMQVVDAALYAAQEMGAHLVDFDSRWSGAQFVYQRGGAHPESAAPPLAQHERSPVYLPALTVLDVSFTGEAAAHLWKLRDTLLALRND